MRILCRPTKFPTKVATLLGRQSDRDDSNNGATMQVNRREVSTIEIHEFANRLRDIEWRLHSNGKFTQHPSKEGRRPRH